MNLVVNRKWFPLIAAIAGTVHGATSVKSGMWSNASTWGGSVPAAAENVTVTAGHSITVDVATATLNLATINGTLVFSGWSNSLSACETVINGTATHLAQSATTTNELGAWVPDSRAWFLCSNLTVASAGKIDVSTKGYRGGSAGTHGAGPGGGLNGWVGSGAGHGGAGGLSSQSSAIYSAIYDTPEAPENPGSGSGGRSTANSGDSGGGVVRIIADGRVTIDGAISANGSSAAGQGYGGGSSGGSIWINCRELAGVGTISANGANTSTDGSNMGGGGGGGRIAMHYDTGAQELVNRTAPPSIVLAANGGWAYSATLVLENAAAQLGVRRYSGENGTIYLSDDSFFPPPLTEGGRVVIPGGLNVARDTLTVRNGVLDLPAGARMALTNDLVFTQNFGGLRMTNGFLDVGGNLTASAINHGFSYVRCATGEAFRVRGAVTIGKGYTFRLYGNETAENGARTRVAINALTITNGGRFCIYAGTTNNVTPDNFGLQLTIDHDAIIATNSFLAPYAHPTNGAACRILLQNLLIMPGGKVNAAGAGFGGGANYGDQYYKHNGFGPGAGINGWLASGAGYGGDGGSISVAAPGGRAYGSIEYPLLPGSGAGGRDSAYGNPSRIGSAGGGLVWIEAAGRITINGAINADGETAGKDFFGGGGSGGAVYLVCDTIAASNGLISANGAPGTTDGQNIGGGGGGGRIALHYNTTSQATINATSKPVLRLAANHGPCWNGSTLNHETYNPGQPGTIWLPDDSFFPGQVLEGGLVVIPNLKRLERDNLTVYNSRAVFDTVDIFVTNDLIIANNFAGLSTTNATITVGGSFAATCQKFGFSYVYLPTNLGLTVRGDLLVTNHYTLRLYGEATPPTVCSIGSNIVVSHGAGLHVYSGITNGIAPDYGLRVDVGGSINTALGGWIYPYCDPTNGGTALFRAQAAVIGTNSGFNANITGYLGGYYGVNPGKTGFGPGGGTTSGGGGHGGVGTATGAGGTYGSVTRPIEAGSGGGGYSKTETGSRGGGAIRLQLARRIILDGTLSANGGRVSAYGGGSAGGSILVESPKFEASATALLSARGGAASNPGGGGGGGRIAVWRTSGYTEATDVTGAGTETTRGTVYWGLIPAPGTIVLLQ